jgi:hypothetical protein
MEKRLSEITREEWISWQWLDITQMGDEERVFLKRFQRTPEEMYNAMMEWEETVEFREVKE